jgi:acyl carrier protein
VGDRPLNTVAEVVDLLTETLALGERGRRLTGGSPLLGHVPELDSMAVIALIQALEQRFGFTVADDDISAATFESVATLVEFVEARRAPQVERLARSA